MDGPGALGITNLAILELSSSRVRVPVGELTWKAFRTDFHTPYAAVSFLHFPQVKTVPL